MSFVHLFDLRTKAYARLRSFVDKELASGHQQQAADRLASAIQKWALNFESGSRASIIRDLDALEWMVRKYEGVVGESKLCDELTNAIDEARGVIVDRNNFRIDGRMMKPVAASQWGSIQSRLKHALKRFVDR